MRHYLISSVVLILVVSILAVLIKYPPYKELPSITVNDDMSLRHIAGIA